MGWDWVLVVWVVMLSGVEASGGVGFGERTLVGMMAKMVQVSLCNGWKTRFLPQHLMVDDIIARSKAGTDNLQLLCGHCNSLKGDRPMEYLRVRLVRRFGI